MDWNTLGVRPCELLIPAEEELFEKWACVACDQFTSQPEYWQKAEEWTEGAPSTLRMIIPECYLGESDTRTERIHQEMRSYLERGVLRSCVKNGMVLTARTTQSGTRYGLVLTVDLECYDYRRGAQSLIRATEMTIESRIPARVKVRREALLETAHVLMLCDDPENTVMNAVCQRKDSLRRLYDFDLMLGGGHLTGWAIEEEENLKEIYDALEQLKRDGGENPFLFAVGDGNHSLASAKAFWEEKKQLLSEEERLRHPARYAMVELENINDPALRFEPIHRVIYCCDAQCLRDDLELWLEKKGMTICEKHEKDTQRFTVTSSRFSVPFHIKNSPYGIAVATVQHFLDEWLEQHTQCIIDYVHGDDVVLSLSKQEQTVGFLLPKPEGDSLYQGVIKNGCLPRKTFSIGEANEKRYYMECRRIEP